MTRYRPLLNWALLLQLSSSGLGRHKFNVLPITFHGKGFFQIPASEPNYELCGTRHLDVTAARIATGVDTGGSGPPAGPSDPPGMWPWMASYGHRETNDGRYVVANIPDL